MVPGNTPNHPRASAPSPWWGLAAVLLISCLIRTQIADIPLERDEGEYGYIAQRWVAGELPYQTSFNQKFPGAFLAYVLIGACLGEGAAAIHWGAQIWSMGTITLLFLAGWRMFSARAGVATAAMAALMLTDQTMLGQSANTEVFAVLFYAAALLSAVRAVESGSAGWAFAAGACGAASMTFKQPGVFNLAFAFVYVVWGSERRVRQGAAVAGGAAAVLGLLFGYFAANGAWAAFYDNTIGHNLSYAARVPLSSYPLVFWAGFVQILRSFWPVGLLAVWGAVGPRLGGMGAGDPEDRRLRANSLVVVVWLAFCAAAVSVGGYYRPHYFTQAVPPVALLAGLGATLIPPPRLGGRPSAKVITFLCVGAAAYAVVVSLWYYLPGPPDEKCRRLYSLSPFPESPAVGRFIYENSSPEDTVLVLGSEPQILYYSRRRSATRYIFAYPMMPPYEDSVDRQKSAMEEVRRNNPKFIVTVFEVGSFMATPDMPIPIFRDLREYMGDRYVVEGAVVVLEQTGGWATKVEFRTGPQVAETYRKNPMWYDSSSWWSGVLVWRRTD